MHESRVRTKGKWESLKHKSSAKRAQNTKKTAKNQVKKFTLSDENKKAVHDILSHELYADHTKGQERVNGILGELSELDLMTDDQYQAELGKEHKFESVEDVESFLGSLEEKK